MSRDSSKRGKSTVKRRRRRGARALLFASVLMAGFVALVAFFLNSRAAEETGEDKVWSSLDDLIRAYVENNGGIEQIRAVHSLRSIGSFFPSSESEGIPFTIIKKRPNLIRNYYEYEHGSVIQAYNGEIAWRQFKPEKSLQPEFSLLTGDEKNNLIRNAYFDHIFIREFENYSTLRFMGTRTFRNHDYYEIRIETEETDIKKSILLDKETLYDPYHITEHLRSDTTTVVHFGKFRKIKGISLPFIITAEDESGFVWRYEIDQIDMNMGISSEFFNPPAEDSR